MNIDKQALRERYSPKPAPECHICGKEMTIQRMSASRITYGCTGATYDDKGCHYAEGRSIADDHYEQSRVTVVDVSDPDVLALLDENIQIQREKDATEAVALALRDDMRQAREQLEEAEHRMAEQSAIVAAAEKLVRCKGRYHSELNYRALAKLFGVITPDLPPLEHENVHYADAAEVEITALRQRIQELEREKPLMVDAMHVAVALNSAGINLNDFDNSVSRLHEWGGLPDYCVALYLDYIHGVVSENKLLDFGYISDNGAFSTRQRIAELEARKVNLSKLSVGEVMHMSGFSRDYAEGWCAGNDNAIHEIRAAGIKVKES
ncbi:ead/Ea22-like family protein [Salmonella enterica subsp. enterica serovar Reading]|nr:ead/Ea22-like family protein [Salmonella enterica subsp. enterica serovar Reading]